MDPEPFDIGIHFEAVQSSARSLLTKAVLYQPPSEPVVGLKELTEGSFCTGDHLLSHCSVA